MSRLYQTKDWLIDLSEIVGVGEIYNEGQWLTSAPYAHFDILFKSGKQVRQNQAVYRQHVLVYSDGTKKILAPGELLAMPAREFSQCKIEQSCDLSEIEQERKKLIAAWKGFLKTKTLP